MSIFRKVLCILMSTMFVLTSCAGEQSDSNSSDENASNPITESTATIEPNSNDESQTSSSDDEIDPADEFIPVFRAIACSDTHVSSITDTTARRLAKLFTSSYSYAEQHQYYNTVDAMLVAGDLTNSGYEYEFDAWKNVVNGNIREETTLITVMGNHEYYGGGQAAYIAKMDSELDKHVVVNGYHFIGLSTRADDSYTEEQLAWLEGELAKAVKDDKNKPIFVFQHHHLQNTVYVSKTWYTSASDRFKRIFKKYPQVIDFSGHSHGPINNPLSIWQDGFTMLATGTLAYFEMESGMTEGTVPKNASDAAQFYIIEVDGNNRVRIMPYNLLTDDFFKTPSNADDEEKQLVYTIDRPSDPDTFLYTKERFKNQSAPYFADGAVVSVNSVSKTGAVLEFPNAFDDSCLYSYRVVATPTDGGGEKVFRFYAEYYFEPFPKNRQVTLSGLKSGTTYNIAVCPVNIWDVEGKPVCTVITTEAKANIEYKSANDVSFMGTFTDFESVDKLTRSGSSFAYGGTVNGDVFGGDWAGNSSDGAVELTLENGRGYNGSKALAVTYNGSSPTNRGLYVFATEQNKNTAEFPDFAYLRLWVDFTDVEFRKACFGLVDANGRLFSTDDTDYAADSPFYYLAEGKNEWQSYQHGGDGCFGSAQAAPVNGFKGWMAFPVSMFGSRNSDGTVFEDNRISALYMYWDFSDASMLGKKFYLDEIQLVEDYKVFENYQK